MVNKQRSILVDADVVSHFITGGESASLTAVFPENQLYILDKVHAELQKWPNNAVRTTISQLFGKKGIRLMEFPEENEEIRREYAFIKSVLFKGDGESACMAVARYSTKILASSNLRDIGHYCDMHGIDYLSTMDFLCHALSTGLYTEARCDAFITTVKRAGGLLPVARISQHRCRDIAKFLLAAE